ncbi:MAG: thioredoxin family protein [Xanthomonadales bacterium]|nr:thioredoxin family protein [Xanthomonadales bacterium]
MTDTTVSFLYFDGCPLAPRARENLLEALGKTGREAALRFEEVDLMDPATPIELKRWGSPTILVNGQDITGARQGEACSCRLYASDGGVPTTREIIEALAKKGSD